jgi:hypothetical protein
VRETLRDAILAVEPKADPAELIRRDHQVSGEFEEHRFDYALANGELHQLVQTLSFEAAEKDALKTEIDALAWAIDDVRRGNSQMPISVVTIGDGKLLENAERVYVGLDASVVREHEIPAWADTAALAVAATRS